MSESTDTLLQPRLLTPEQAGIILNASAWTACQMVRSGVLKHVPRGRKIFIDIKEIDAYIDRTKMCN